MKTDNVYDNSQLEPFKNIVKKSVLIGLVIILVLLVLSILSVVSYFSILGYSLGLLTGIGCFLLTVKNLYSSNYVFYKKVVKRTGTINKLIFLVVLGCGYFIVFQNIIAYILIPIGILTTKVAIITYKTEVE